MTAAKVRKFKRAASLYTGEHEDLVSDKKGWRLDLIALTIKDKDFSICHYENI